MKPTVPELDAAPHSGDVLWTATDLPSKKDADTPLSRSVFWARVRVALAALSLANLCLIHAWFASYFDRDFGYFNKLPVSATTLLALLCNLALLTLLFWFAAFWLQRRRNRLLICAGHVLSIAPLLIPLDLIRMQFFRVADYEVIQFLRKPLTLLVLIALGVVVVRWHKCTAKILTAFLLIVSPLALVTVSKAALLLMGICSIVQDSRQQTRFAPLLPNTEGARVVWIIFDELDYRRAFERRPAGVCLAELDRLGRESFHATHAYPPGSQTLLSIPALTTGRAVREAIPANPRELLLTLSENEQQTGWTELPTVFSDAREIGENVGIIGWCHPYERLFNSVVSFCAWYPPPNFEPARAPLFLQTMERQICSMASPLNLRWLHMRNYQQMLQDATTLVTNENYGLVFLHLPVPHKPGIYDAQKAKLTFLSVPGDRGYDGNLVLVDQTFGKLRREMDKPAFGKRRGSS